MPCPLRTQTTHSIGRYIEESMPRLFRLHSVLWCTSPFRRGYASTDFNSSNSAFGITSYTAGITGVMEEFDVSMTVAILGFSLNLLGIAFAPIMTPHITERLGRSPVYLASLPLYSLFILGASRSDSYSSLAICRFFAGFFGGPCLVLIEGTFADCWRGHTTVTYYSVLSLSSYIGAACGMAFMTLSQRPNASTSFRMLIMRSRAAYWGVCLCIYQLAMDSVRHINACSCGTSSWHRTSRNLQQVHFKTAGRKTWTSSTKVIVRSERCNPTRYGAGDFPDTLQNAVHGAHRCLNQYICGFQFRGALPMVHRRPSRFASSLRFHRSASGTSIHCSNRGLDSSCSDVDLTRQNYVPPSLEEKPRRDGRRRI